MAGYLDAETQHEKLRLNVYDDHSEYCIFTGDEGYIDEQGYLYLCGRQDSMCKINGNRVYPQEVGELMLQVPGILSAEVFGVKDSLGKAHLVAFVIPDSNVELTEDSIHLQVGQMAPSYMVPKRVELLDEYPKTLTGKIDRVTLIARAKELIGIEEPQAVTS